MQKGLPPKKCKNVKTNKEIPKQKPGFRFFKKNNIFQTKYGISQIKIIKTKT